MSHSDDLTLNYFKKSREDNTGEPDSLMKAMNRAGLVQKDVQVRGKNGQTFTRKQWVKAGEDSSSPTQSSSNEEDDKQSKSSITTNFSVGQKVKCDQLKGTWQVSDDKSTFSNKIVLQNAKGTVKKEVPVNSLTAVESSSNKSTSKEVHSDTWKKVGSSQEAKQQIASVLASGKSREDCMTEFKKLGVTWKENDHAGINWMRASMAMNKYLTSVGNDTEVNKSSDSVTNTDKDAEDISESSQSNTPSAKEIQSIADNIKRTTIKIREANSAYFTSGYTDQNAKDRQDKADEESKKYTEKLEDIIDNMPDGTRLTYTFVDDDGTTEKTSITFDTVTLQHKDPRYNGKTTKQMIIKWKDKNGKNHTHKVQKMFDYGYSVGIEHDFGGRGGSGKVTDISVNYPNNSSAQSKISESKKTKKSVIGSDYTQLVTGKESGTIEGEAHNMMVNELGSEGKKKPTEFVIKGTATYLKVNALKTVISSYNQDELVHQLALAKQFTKLAGGNIDHMTIEDIYKDVVNGRGSYTQEQKCNAMSKLLGPNYTSSANDTVARYSNYTDAAVEIRPLSRGNFEVTFTYGDGAASTKETYDSIDSVKKAADKWIDKEDGYYQKDKDRNTPKK